MEIKCSFYFNKDILNKPRLDIDLYINGGGTINGRQMEILKRVSRKDVSCVHSNSIRNYGLNVEEQVVFFIQKNMLRVSTVNEVVDSFTVVELREMLRNHGLKVSGKKAELVERIKSNFKPNEVPQFSKTILKNTYELTEYGEKLLEYYENEYIKQLTNLERTCYALISKGRYNEAYQFSVNYKYGLGNPTIGASEEMFRCIHNQILTPIEIKIDPHYRKFERQIKISIIAFLFTHNTNSAYYYDTSQRIFGANAWANKDDANTMCRYLHSLIVSQYNLNSYKESKGKQYKFLASLDFETCEVCGRLDGQKFYADQAQRGINYPPMHEGCRCTTVPVIEIYGEEVDDGKRFARKPETARIKYDPRYKDFTLYYEEVEYVPATMTWTQWYKEKVEGNPIAKIKKQMWDNRYADLEQQQEYRSVLGRKVPADFEKFQNIKYNEPERWAEIQKAYNEAINQNNLR